MHLTQENTAQQQLKCGLVDALRLVMEMTAGLTVECCQQIGDMDQAQIYREKILTHQVET